MKRQDRSHCLNENAGIVLPNADKYTGQSKVPDKLSLNKAVMKSLAIQYMEMLGSVLKITNRFRFTLLIKVFQVVVICRCSDVVISWNVCEEEGRLCHFSKNNIIKGFSSHCLCPHPSEN